MAEAEIFSNNKCLVTKPSKQIVVFPEGTTTNGDELLRFHTMLFNPSMMAGKWVQTVAIRYTGIARPIAPFIGDDAFIPHLIQVLGLKKIDVLLVFSPPLDSSGYSRNELAHRSYQQILANLTEPRLVTIRKAG